jgi:hypothetical protein
MFGWKFGHKFSSPEGGHAGSNRVEGECSTRGTSHWSQVWLLLVFSGTLWCSSPPKQTCESCLTSIFCAQVPRRPSFCISFKICKSDSSRSGVLSSRNHPPIQFLLVDYFWHFFRDASPPQYKIQHHCCDHNIILYQGLLNWPDTNQNMLFRVTMLHLYITHINGHTRSTHHRKIISSKNDKL